MLKNLPLSAFAALSTVCLHVAQVVVNNLNQSFIDVWLLWDLTHMISLLLISSALFVEISYSRVITKTIVLLAAALSSWTIGEYLILYFLPDGQSDLLLSNAVISCAFFIFLLLNVFASAYTLRFKGSDKYNAKDSFLVYMPPKTVFGSFISCICGLHSSVSLVIEGRQFAFSKGKVIERRFKERDGQYFKRLQSAPLLPKGIIGQKWRPWRNCFSVFRYAK